MAIGGGETEKDPSGWTVDTLRAHFEQRFIDLDLRLDQRFDAQNTALSEKNETIQARLDSVNEFRGQQADIIAKTMPRDEIEARFKSMEGRVETGFQALEAKVDAGLQAMNAKVDAGVAARTDAIAVVNSRLDTVNSRLDLTTGTAAGLDKSRQIIGWAVAVLVGLSSLAFILIERAP